MIKYNDNFDLNDDDQGVKFLHVDSFYNKLSLQLPANNSIICIMKKQVIEIDDEKNKLPKPKAI